MSAASQRLKAKLYGLYAIDFLKAKVEFFIITIFEFNIEVSNKSLLNAMKMVKACKVLLVLICSFLVVGCGGNTEVWLATINCDSTETPQLVAENMVIDVPNDGIVRLPNKHVNNPMVFRFQQKGLTRAAIKCGVGEQPVQLSIPKLSFFSSDTSFYGSVRYKSNNFGVEIPLDSLPYFVNGVYLQGWEGDKALYGNILPGGELVADDMNQLLWSANFTLMTSEIDGVIDLRQMKKVPIHLSFNLPDSVMAAHCVLPMWHFDETNCVWTQETTAFLIDGSYDCNVDKLGWWACVEPVVPVKKVCLYIHDSEGTPIYNAHLRVKSTKTKREALLNSAVDGTCTFYVNTNDSLQLYCEGVGLLQWQFQEPFTGVYRNVSEGQKLLFSELQFNELLHSSVSNEPIPVEIDIDLRKICKKKGVATAIPAVTPRDFQQVCSEKCKVNGIGAKSAALEIGSKKHILKKDDHFCVFPPSITNLSSFKDEFGSDRNVWEKISDYCFTPYGIEFKPFPYKKGETVTVYVSGVYDAVIDTCYDQNNKAFYRIREFRVMGSNSSSFNLKYYLVVSNDTEKRILQQGTETFGVDRVVYCLSYISTNGNYVERAIYPYFELNESDEIAIYQPITVTAYSYNLKVQKKLNILSVKDRYGRNALLDVQKDHINPLMFSGNSLTFEFAGLDSVFNTTINIPPLFNYVKKAKESKGSDYSIFCFLALIFLSCFLIAFFKDKIGNYVRIGDKVLYNPVAAVLKLSPSFSDRQKNILLVNDYFFYYSKVSIPDLMKQDENKLLSCLPLIVKNYDFSKRRELCHILFKLAAQDDGIKNDEWILINRIMIGLKLNQKTIDYLHRHYSPLRTEWDDTATNSSNNNQSSNAIKRPADLGDYVVLGLDNGATLEQVKKAYHDLALQYHPDLPKNADRHKECVEKMAAINVAYRRLLDNA